MNILTSQEFIQVNQTIGIFIGLFFIIFGLLRVMGQPKLEKQS